MVDDIRGEIYFIFQPQSYIPEPATVFILLFQLGMLSRYYPDLWMAAIDHDVRIAEFVDSLLNIAFRKFPNLMLDQLTGVKHSVHS